MGNRAGRRAAARAGGGRSACRRWLTQAAVGTSALAVAAVGTVVTAGPAAAEMVFDVTNLDDSGPGSLREALEAANATPGRDQVRFDHAMDGVVTLQSPLTISDDTVLDGPPTVHLDGAGATQVLVLGDPDRTIDVQLFGLTLEHGASDSDGGVIAARNTLLGLQGVTVQGGWAARNGGGVHALGGQVYADSHTRIVGNGAEDEGGGLWADAPVVFNRGSEISHNKAVDGDGGGARLLLGGVLDGAYVSQNISSHGNGGGLAVGQPVRRPSISLRHVSIVGNAAREGSGGGLYLFEAPADIQDVMVYGNSAGVDGGGVLVTGEQFNASFTAQGIDLLKNSAGGSGGGLAVRAPLPAGPVDMSVAGARVAGNTAGGAGAALDLEGRGRAVLTDLDVRENTGGADGAVLRAGAGVGLEMVNSTLTGNDAGARAVVQLSGADMGPEWVDATLDHVTLADNTGAVGLAWDQPGVARVGNSVFSGTKTVDGDPAADLEFPLDGVSVTWSLVETAPLAPGADNAGHVLFGVDPVLEPGSADGYQIGRSPAAGSPVIDAGDPGYADRPGALRDDQRGNARIAFGLARAQVARTDMGAVEVPVPFQDPPPVETLPVPNPPVQNPPVTEPPVTEPPVQNPPVTEPPVTEPPVQNPPVTEPPVTEPPVTEPPVTGPPTTEPPVETPPVVLPRVPVTVPTAELTLTTDKGAITTATPGQQITVIGTGFQPLSLATVVIYSSPQVLATVPTDANGDFSVLVEVPAGLEAGQHSLVASGFAPDGSERFLRMDVTVDGEAAVADPSAAAPPAAEPAPAGAAAPVAAAATPVASADVQETGLAYTGVSVVLPTVVGLSVLAAGAVLLVIARRRRVS
jgi:hypothetical protein